jgi:hypothetical protein
MVYSEPGLWKWELSRACEVDIKVREVSGDALYSL